MFVEGIDIDDTEICTGLYPEATEGRVLHQLLVLEDSVRFIGHIREI